MILNEEIKRIRQVMGLVVEQEQRNLDKVIMVYPRGMGVEYGEEIPTSETYYIPLGNVLANEVFKDQDYFLSNENVTGMIQKLKEGGQLEPIMVIQHPEDEERFLVLDGHHRRFAYEYANRLDIPARIVSYDSILLGDENGKVISSLDKELSNKELLDKYFVSPSGEHGFEKED
jgi:hypothetical protein